MPEILRPTYDGTTTNWTPSTGSDHYAMIDDGTTQPTEPAQTTYISGTSSQVDEIGVATGTFTTITQATVWVYAKQNGPGTESMYVNVSFDSGATYETQQNTDWTSTAEWQSIIFTVTETDSSQIEVKFTDRDFQGVGALEVYEAYVELTGSAPSGYANKVNGIVGGKINGIPVANIAKVNGV